MTLFELHQLQDGMELVLDIRSVLPAPSASEKSSVISRFELRRRTLLMVNSQLFAGIAAAEVERGAELARWCTLEKGDILFAQGQPFRKLIILESGCVKLNLLSARGAEVILALMGAGEAIDLPPACSPSSHTCTAQAVIAGLALTWRSSDVEAMVNTIPRLTQNMYLILNLRMVELRNRIHELSSDPVARRLACTLIRLSDHLGVQDGMGLEIRITRQELAQMCGMTLFTVSRLISKWAGIGLVLPRREAVVVLNKERLDQITSLGEFAP